MDEDTVIKVCDMEDSERDFALKVAKESFKITENQRPA